LGFKHTDNFALTKKALKASRCAATGYRTVFILFFVVKGGSLSEALWKNKPSPIFQAFV